MTMENMLKQRWRDASPDLTAQVVLALRKNLPLEPIVSQLPGPPSIEPATDLRGIDLSQQELIGLDFSCTDLLYACFDGAKMRGSMLSGCNITGTSFIGARMEGLLFTGGGGEGAIFDKCHLQGAALFGSVWKGCSFVGAKLNGAEISGWLAEANFSEADLTGARVGCGMSNHVIFSKARMWGTHVVGEFDGCQFDGVDFRGAMLEGSFSNCVFDDPEWAKSRINKTQFGERIP